MYEDEKVRRNLVVFCGVVLVANYLDVSFTKIATKFLNLEDATLDPLRVLSLTLVILVYLAIRYRFSEEGLKYSETLKAEWNQLCLERIQRWCTWAVMLYSRKRIDVPGIFAANLSDVLSVTSGQAIQANKGQLPNLHQVQFSMSSAGPEVWRYQAFATFRWRLPADGAEVPTEGLVNVEYSGAMLMALKTCTTLESWLYSKGSIHALIPVVLGNFAAITLTLKIINLTPT